MQRTGEMGVHAYLCRESATHDSSLKSSVPDGVEPIGDDRVDMRSAGKETVHTHDAGRQLVVFVANECRLLQLHRDSLYILARVQSKHRCGVRAKGLTLDRLNKQHRIELREELLHQHPKTVHDAQHGNHSSRDNGYRCGADAGNDIDGIVPFLREKVPPSYMRLKGAAHGKTFTRSLVNSLIL